MGEERKVYKVFMGKPEGKNHLEVQGVGGKMATEWILRRLAWRGVDWIRLSQDTDRWRAAVSAVMNLRVLAPRS
jgi:hypothetical protein